MAKTEFTLYVPIPPPLKPYCPSPSTKQAYNGSILNKKDI